jgi:di/tricarboxylate transporter
VQIAVLLTLLVVATFLLATERLRADLVAMLVLASLVAIRVLEPGQALSGFSNPATVTVACMFVLSAGLQASGTVQVLGNWLLKHGPSSETGLLIVTALVIAPVSAFINNTAAVAIFLPMVLRACQGRGVSPSHLMMPLSFFAMLGGSCTLIGTSTNLLVSSLATQHGARPFGMFEFTVPGLLLLGMGAAYLLLIGRRLIPERVEPTSLTEGFHLNRYLSEVVVLEESPLIGQNLREARLGERFDLEVLAHVRKKVMRGLPDGYDSLDAGDILLVKAPVSALVQIRDAAGIAVRPGRHPGDADLRSGDSALIEAVIMPNSELEGRTLKSSDFRNRYRATALAIRRHGEDIREKIGKVKLHVGDELLVLAQRNHVDRLRLERGFVILQELDLPVIKPAMAITACLIIVGGVTAATTGRYTIVDAAIVGAVLMVLTGCLPARRAYADIDWQVIFLLAGLIPMGMALESTGAASAGAEWITGVAGRWGPQAVLGTFIFMTASLTGVMSNTATAALLAPLAITMAGAIGVDPRPFLVGLTFAASAAFHTPIGYQTNMLVYGPGGYRFFDFIRVGGPLTILYCLFATMIIPLLFPF